MQDEPTPVPNGPTSLAFLDMKPRTSSRQDWRVEHNPRQRKRRIGPPLRRDSCSTTGPFPRHPKRVNRSGPLNPPSSFPSRELHPCLH
jgi:hypothetical protein